MLAPRTRALIGPAATAAALATAAIVLALFLAAGGFDVPRALGAMWDGSFGSGYAFTSATLVRATPLALAGLAVALAFRAGVLNVGAEGQLVAGAAAAAAMAVTVGPMVGRLALPLALAAGALCGALWAGIAALFRRRFGVLEVISTIMLNFVAQYGVSYLVRGPLQEPTHVYPQTVELPAGALLPRLAGTRLHLGAAIAVAAAVLLWWALSRTAAGFRVRAVGANPHAAASAGLIDVAAVTSGAFLLSGALAGLAGAVEVTGVTYVLYENVSPGYGYTAIAVALLARLHPLAVIPAAVLFGALESGANAMQRDAGVPSVVAGVVEAVVVLAVLAANRAAERRAGGAVLPDETADALAPQA